MALSLGLGIGITRGQGGFGPPIPKTVVVLGSSNGAGQGASTFTGNPTGPTWASPSTSWAGLLTTGLKAIDSGWSVINRSISGSGTTASLARFWTDVAPHRPSHVIICTHPINDSYDFTLIYNNTVQLVALCHMIGAIPILRGGYMANGPTAPQYSGMLQLNRDFDALGYHRIDHMSTLDDGTGDFISPGTYDVDGLHPNDAGYAVLYSAIDLGVFIAGQALGPETGFADGAWRVVTNGADAILISSATGLRNVVKSFTLSFDLLGVASGGNTARAFSGMLPATQGRFRNATAALLFTADAGTVDKVTTTYTPSADATPRRVTLTYNRPTNTGKVYLDATEVGSFSYGAAADVTAFVFASRETATVAAAQGYSFSDPALWLVPLPAAAVARLESNDFQGGSMIFRGKMGAAPGASGTTIPNAVRNGIAPTLGVTWEAVSPF
jgi:lysophospholipase L1-like esterase